MSKKVGNWFKNTTPHQQNIYFSFLLFLGEVIIKQILTMFPVPPKYIQLYVYLTWFMGQEIMHWKAQKIIKMDIIYVCIFVCMYIHRLMGFGLLDLDKQVMAKASSRKFRQAKCLWNQDMIIHKMIFFFWTWKRISIYINNALHFITWDSDSM